MNRRLISAVIISVFVVATAGVVIAEFIDKSKVLGASFSVGSADIKLLKDLSLGTELINLVDDTPGPGFNNIGPNWSADYLMKIFNNGTSKVTVKSHANYSTSNDPDSLRDVIYAEIFAWSDLNSNGIVDPGEKGNSMGAPKTILRWKNDADGIILGEIESGQVKAYIVTFSTLDLSSTKQGKSGMFDFEFESA